MKSFDSKQSVVHFLSYKLLSTSWYKLHLYADDGNIQLSGSSEEDLELSSGIDLHLPTKYFNNKQLVLNPDKTKFVTFETRQTKVHISLTIKINQKFISEVDHINF